MKIAVRKNEVYINYEKRFTDEQIQEEPYNYTIHEVGEVPADCMYTDFDYIGERYVFNFAKYAHRKAIPQAEDELNSLTEWFEWYDRQVQEYARCQRLGIEYTNTLGLTLTELDNLAEEKKARINELRQIIGG